MAETTIADTLHKVTRFEDSSDLETNVIRLTHAAKILNSIAITDFGGRQGHERQRGLVEQVVAAAFQTFEGEEAHPDIFEKAAIVLRGITGGHPFEDGNKRTGFLATCYLLEQYGIELPQDYPIDEAEALCLQNSSGQLRDIGEITVLIRKIWKV